jgi:hypothetical protein
MGMPKKAIPGVDLGGVVIQDRPRPRSSSWNRSQDLTLPEIDHAFDAIEYFVRLGRMPYVVSSGGEDVIAVRRQWLGKHRFFERTGMSLGRLKWCGSRDDKQHFLAHLGITHYVDNRVEVALALDPAVVPRVYLLNPDPHEKVVRRPCMRAELGPSVKRYADWLTLCAALRHDMDTYEEG